MDRRAPITRRPSPAALARSAFPIVASASRRRRRHESGNKTWVFSHDLQRERLGTSAVSTPSSRSARLRAEPQGRNSPPQPGQKSTPAPRDCSTAARSLSTMSTDASGRFRRTPSCSARVGEGVLAFTGRPHPVVARPTAQPLLSAQRVDTLNARKPRGGVQGMCRSTTLRTRGQCELQECATVRFARLRTSLPIGELRRPSRCLRNSAHPRPSDWSVPGLVRRACSDVFK